MIWKLLDQVQRLQNKITSNPNMTEKETQNIFKNNLTETQKSNMGSLTFLQDEVILPDRSLSSPYCCHLKSYNSNPV